MKIILFISILVFGLIGCQPEKEVVLNNLTDLQFPDGYVDVPLTIAKTKKLANYYEYDVSAILKTDTIGMIVRLKKNIRSGFKGGMPANMFLKDGIEFASKGPESDQLLRYLSHAYGRQDADISLKNSQIFTCANLNAEKVNYKNGDFRFKIFLEEEEEYAELYVNFDFSTGIVSLSEKDKEYRETLINLLKK